MTDEADFTETGDAADILEAADVVLGFAWHAEENHWHLASYSFPDTFDEQQEDRLETLAEQFADELTKAGLTISDQPE